MEIIEQENFRVILENYAEKVVEQKRRNRVELVEATCDCLPASDEGEKACANHQLGVSLGLYEFFDQIFKKINAALQRIREGTFGECINLDCHNKIPLARLEAVPWTDKCIKCQEAEEKA